MPINLSKTLIHSDIFNLKFNYFANIFIFFLSLLRLQKFVKKFRHLTFL